MLRERQLDGPLDGETSRPGLWVDKDQESKMESYILFLQHRCSSHRFLVDLKHGCTMSTSVGTADIIESSSSEANVFRGCPMKEESEAKLGYCVE
jgi:hypothetical protein